MSITSWWSLTHYIENQFRNTVQSFSSQDLWKETAIAIDLVKESRKILNGVSLEEAMGKVRIESKLFCADGALEENYGDIGVSVKIRYRDGFQLSGISYYEAKRRDWKSQTIPAAKRPQLEKMYKNLRHGHLIVFDREPVEIPMASIMPPWWISIDGRLYNYPAVTHVVSMPLDPVLQSNKIDPSIYRFGLPWSVQIVLRNLHGFDLEHDQHCINWSNMYAEGMNSPALILAIGVNHGEETPEFPEPPGNQYRQID